MRRTISILFLLACGGTNTKTPVDAAPDTANLPACTGVAYDACNPANSNCSAGLTCKTFTGSGFSVCTPSCTTTCPMQGSAAVTCNNMGLCKPAAPNACTPP